MNLKTTIFMLLLGAGVAALFWKGPELAPRLRLGPENVEESDRGTVAELANLKDERIASISAQSSDGKQLYLAAPQAGESLNLPGRWPVRRHEVGELLAALTSIRSRFAPIPLSENADLKPYGLDPSQRPIHVVIQTGSKKRYSLMFGEEPLAPGGNPFQRAAFVRLNETMELIRLGDDVLPLLRRTEDAYRRRQLFPEMDLLPISGGGTGRSERENVQAVPNLMLPSDAIVRIAMQGPAGGFVLERVKPNPQPIADADKPTVDPHVTLERLAECWVLVEPVRDRVEPKALRNLLAAIPELMVEKFDEDRSEYFKKSLPKEEWLAALSIAQSSAPGGCALGSAATSLNLIAKPPAPRLTIHFAGGGQRSLIVGRVSRSSQRFEMERPMFQGQPPQRRVIKEEYRFAELADNPLSFDLKDDLLNELLAVRTDDSGSPPPNMLTRLRDTRSIRFQPATVKRIRITQPAEAGNKPRQVLEFVKTKGDSASRDEETKKDHWSMTKPIAKPVETSAVTELLDALQGMEATAASIIDSTPLELAKGDLSTDVVLSLSPFGSRIAPAELVVGSLAAAKRRVFNLTPERAGSVVLETDAGELTLLMGNRTESDKRFVSLPGWDRIDVVDDRTGPSKLSKFDRQPSAYLALRLIDRSRNPITSISVQRPATNEQAADSFTIVNDTADPIAPWTITAPFQAIVDKTLAPELTGALSNLGNLTYAYDSSCDAPFVSASAWPKFEVGVKPFTSEIDLTNTAFFGLDKPVVATFQFAPTFSLTHSLASALSNPDWGAHVLPIPLFFLGDEELFAFVRLKDSAVVEIGRARSGGEHFARIKGTTGIFTVSEQVAAGFNRKPHELVERGLLQFKKDEAQSFRRTLGKVDFQIGQNAKAEWELVKPLIAKADAGTVDGAIEQLANLRAARIHDVLPREWSEHGLQPPAAALSFAVYTARNAMQMKYGLHPPYATVTVEVLQRSKLVEKTLLFGNLVVSANPDGDRFAQVPGSPNVAVIPGPLAKKLTASASTFRDRSVGDGFLSADKIVIERGERKIAFAKGPGGWKVSEPLSTDADDQGLRDLHDALAAKPKAEEIVEDKPKDLAKYGLDKPEHLRFFNGDKEVLHLLIGSPETIGPDKKLPGLRAYAMIDKADTVCLLDSRLTHMLKDEYRKRELWPAPRPEQIMAIAIKAADPKDSFTFTKGPMGLIDLAKKDEPLQQVLLSDLMFALAEPQVEKFVIDKGPVDLKLYGLDKPRTATITLMGDKKYTLLLGTLLDGKNFYARIDDPTRTDVFLLSEVDSRALNRSRGEYAVKKDEPKKEPDPKKKDEPKK